MAAGGAGGTLEAATGAAGASGSGASGTNVGAGEGALGAGGVGAGQAASEGLRRASPGRSAARRQRRRCPAGATRLSIDGLISMGSTRRIRERVSIAFVERHALAAYRGGCGERLVVSR